MKPRRKHTDLWIVGALFAGVFAFQHGEEALAAVRPPFALVKNTVSARWAALAASEPSDVTEDGVGNADLVPPGNANVNAVQRDSAAVSFPPHARPAFRPVFRRPASPTLIGPACEAPCHHGYAW